MDMNIEEIGQAVEAVTERVTNNYAKITSIGTEFNAEMLRAHAIAGSLSTLVEIFTRTGAGEKASIARAARRQADILEGMLRIMKAMIVESRTQGSELVQILEEIRESVASLAE